MLQNREGQRVPNVTFPVREGNTWKKLTSDDIFKNKTVVVFSLPGAFTPTCSSTHLPRYNELAPTFFKEGVDSIVCVSVNDTFVMNEWAKDQESANITLLPDGNGAFTEGMGMLVDKSDLGFGKRSWRYSMLVKDGVVQKMFIEPEKEGDPFEVSDADTMLAYFAPRPGSPTRWSCSPSRAARSAWKPRRCCRTRVSIRSRSRWRTRSAAASSAPSRARAPRRRCSSTAR